MTDNTPPYHAPPIAEILVKRGQDFLPLLRCPHTQQPLTRDGNVLVSQSEPPHQYTSYGEVLRLVADEQRAQFDAKSNAEAATHEKAGRVPLTIEDFRRLPQTAPPNGDSDYWQRRAVVTAEMWRVLEAIRVDEERLPIGSMGEAVDLTDGMGWIGYGLDVSGYITIALGHDVGPYGLGVFPHTRYLRVQASLAAPPLTPDKFDLVTFSFSLETLEEPLLALQNAARLLKHGGTLVVLSDQATVNLDEAQATLQTAGLEVQQQRVGAMGGKYSRRLKNLTGRRPGVPPLVVARRLG